MQNSLGPELPSAGSSPESLPLKRVLAMIPIVDVSLKASLVQTYSNSWQMVSTPEVLMLVKVAVSP